MSGTRDLERRFLTMTEAAERLKITPRLVRRLVQERRIRYHKAGRTILIEEKDILDFIDRHTVEPFEPRGSRPHRGRSRADA